MQYSGGRTVASTAGIAPFPPSLSELAARAAPAAGAAPPNAAAQAMVGCLCEVLVRADFQQTKVDPSSTSSHIGATSSSSTPAEEGGAAGERGGAFWFPAIVHRYEPWRGDNAFQLIAWVGATTEQTSGRPISVDGVTANSIERTLQWTAPAVPMELPAAAAAAPSQPPPHAVSAHLWCTLPSPAVRLTATLSSAATDAAAAAAGSISARARAAAWERIPRAVAKWAGHLADCDAAAHLAARWDSAESALPPTSPVLGDAQAAILAPYLARTYAAPDSDEESSESSCSGDDEGGEEGDDDAPTKAATKAAAKLARARARRDLAVARVRGSLVERLESQLRGDIATLLETLPALLVPSRRSDAADVSFQTLRDASMQIARLADASVGWTVAAPLLPQSVAALVNYHKSRLHNAERAVRKTDERFRELESRVQVHNDANGAEMAALQEREDGLGPKVGAARAEVAVAQQRRVAAEARVREATLVVETLRPSVEAAEAAFSRVVSTKEVNIFLSNGLFFSHQLLFFDFYSTFVIE